MKLICLILFFLTVLSQNIEASEHAFKVEIHSQSKEESAWNVLNEKADRIENERSNRGWGYVFSGAVATAISVPAYFLSQDVFSKAVFSIGQTLGVAAVGYGGYLISVNDELASFRQIVRSVPEVTLHAREALARQYLIKNGETVRKVRRIRIITHGLTAGLNFTNAFTSSNAELKNSLYFLGGINLLAVIGLAFEKTDEEKIEQKFRSVEFRMSVRGLQLAICF